MKYLSENFPFAPKRFPFFYGYMIAFSATLGYIFSAPGQTIGISVFTDHLIRHLHISRFQLSLAYAAGTIASAMIIRKSSKLIDVFGSRMIAFLSAAGLGITLLLMSRIDHVSFFISQDRTSLLIPVAIMTVTFGFLCMRFFGQGMLTLSSRTMLMQWFVEKRGRINSVTSIFVSLMFSGAPLVFEVLIRRHGWRNAWSLLGVSLIFFLSVFIFLFYRNLPETCGLIPDGSPPVKNPEDPIETSWRLHEARHTGTFWAFNLGLSLFSLLITAVTFHIVSIFELKGFPRQDAISVFLPSSLIAVNINLIAGWLSDTHFFKYRMKYLLILMLGGLMLVSMGSMGLQQCWGKPVLIIGNGLASGLFATLVAVVWPRFYGRQHLGEIAGYNMAFLVFFSAVGPPLFGWSFSLFHSYSYALMISMVLVLGLLILAMKADRPLQNT